LRSARAIVTPVHCCAQILPFGALRKAIAASCEQLVREIQALIHTCCVSRCLVLQAAFVRCIPRLLSCSSSAGSWLPTPIIWDLRSLLAPANTTLQVLLHAC
jgi:hypothetical protein